MPSVVMYPCVEKPGQDEKRPHAAGYVLIGPDRVREEEATTTAEVVYAVVLYEAEVVIVEFDDVFAVVIWEVSV